MNDKDKAVFEYWQTTMPCLTDLPEQMAFEYALAHRDEQVKGLVEALESVLLSTSHASAIHAAGAALVRYKEQTK